VLANWGLGFGVGVLTNHICACSPSTYIFSSVLLTKQQTDGLGFVSFIWCKYSQVCTWESELLSVCESRTVV
jgi:hypothetical protein